MRCAVCRPCRFNRSHSIIILIRHNSLRRIGISISICSSICHLLLFDHLHDLQVLSLLSLVVYALVSLLLLVLVEGVEDGLKLIDYHWVLLVLGVASSGNLLLTLLSSCWLWWHYIVCVTLILGWFVITHRARIALNPLLKSLNLRLTNLLSITGLILYLGKIIWGLYLMLSKRFAGEVSPASTFIVLNFNNFSRFRHWLILFLVLLLWLLVNGFVFLEGHDLLFNFVEAHELVELVSYFVKNLQLILQQTSLLKMTNEVNLRWNIMLVLLLVIIFTPINVLWLLKLTLCIHNLLQDWLLVTMGSYGTNSSLVNCGLGSSGACHYFVGLVF